MEPQDDMVDGCENDCSNKKIIFSSIFTENKLNGDNFREWKWNLLIVLNYEKHKFVLDESCPHEDILTRLLNKIGTLVKEHMLKLMGFFVEVEENGAKLDVNSQIEIVFKSLTNEFIGFRAAYNLGNKALTLT
ncbi:hypothetical protein J1N35_029001 [Gossypium stocksii]|uniref:Uncharacterized protein n=1 Tax=Gossypium stocksii TaxID=47602 RepID=A0A9D3ZSN6_9ROSI|nr:hypothetical protein J1N35_029001 [Gossypium stocksii]